MSAQFDYVAEYAKLKKRPHLTWAEAVEAMKSGAIVRRARDMFYDTVDSDRNVMESGMEATRLHMAVTESGDFVKVFQGAVSRVLYGPDEEATSSNDWIVVDDKRLW